MISTLVLFYSILALFYSFDEADYQRNMPEMVLIKGGTFLMGQMDGEGDERPVHKVTLDDFYIGKYEITVREYKMFCEATKRQMPIEPSWGWVDSHPIINTTWYDAMEYIEWLNKELNEDFRLPTEAEFEYVIRNGGKEGVYPWEDTNSINENIADETYKKTNPSRSIWQSHIDNYEFTSPVGSFKPNQLGVYDINGNIWEWCSDWYEAYNSKQVLNPKGADKGKHKVGRGSSYNADPWHTRSASRSYVDPNFNKPGFRLAKDKV